MSVGREQRGLQNATDETKRITSISAVFNTDGKFKLANIKKMS